MRAFIRIEEVNRLNRILIPRLDAIDHGVGQDLAALALDLRQRRRRIVFGGDRTYRKAVVVAATWRPAVIGDAAVARLRRRQVDHADFRGGLGETMLAGTEGNWPHRVGFRAFSIGRPLQRGVGRTAHADRVFRACVIGLDHIVAEWPVPADPIKAFQAHVIGRDTPADSGPVPGSTSRIADVTLEIGAGIRPLQLKVLLVLFGGARFEVRRPRLRRIGRIPVKQPYTGRKVAKILDDSPAIDARAGLEHQHGQASVQGLLRDQATDHPGSHDNNVCTIIARHLYSSRWFESTVFRIQACCSAEEPQPTIRSAPRSRRREWS